MWAEVISADMFATRFGDGALDAATRGARGGALRALYLSSCPRVSNAAVREVLAPRCARLRKQRGGEGGENH